MVIPSSVIQYIITNDIKVGLLINQTIKGEAKMVEKAAFLTGKVWTTPSPLLSYGSQCTTDNREICTASLGMKVREK